MIEHALLRTIFNNSLSLAELMYWSGHWPHKAKFWGSNPNRSEGIFIFIFKNCLGQMPCHLAKNSIGFNGPWNKYGSTQSECYHADQLFIINMYGSYHEVTQSDWQRWVNNVVPINISRCQHLTGSFSGYICAKMTPYFWISKEYNLHACNLRQSKFLRV